MAQVQVGFVPSAGMLPRLSADRRALVQLVVEQGIDHLGVLDHVSFFDGIGFDGLINATSLLQLDDTIPVHVGVYVLPLRNPLVVARQLATIADIAPGRLVFGVGIGGEDRHEYDICGVDPHTRGARMDEALPLLQRLLSGETVTHHGRFFDIENATVLPAPDPGIPMIVGGRSDAALRRTARFGQGWIGIWVSPRRYADSVATVAREAASIGRGDTAWQHELTVWCGLAARHDVARSCLVTSMETLYKLPFERFERYSPVGTAEDIAAFLMPYVDAGCRTFNLIAEGPDIDTVVTGVGMVRKLLAER